MKRILVPTDFSDCSMHALRVAAEFARKLDCAITLAHVYEVPIYGLEVGGMAGLSYDGKALAEIKEKIHEELVKISKLDYLQGITLEKMVLAERSITEILEHEKLKDVELIVMGSHGASGIKESLIGSNTEKIVRKADYPVLTIKQEIKDFDATNIVFASDFYGEIGPAFDKFRKIMDPFNPNYHLLKVVTASRFERSLTSEKLMSDFAEKHNLENYTLNVFNDDTVEEGVLNFADTIEADLVCMPTHARTGISYLINGSITEDLVNHSATPMMSIHILEPKVEYGIYYPEMR